MVKIIAKPSNGESGAQSAMSRGLAILEWVTSQDRPVTSVETAEALELPRATVHRIMVQLEEQTYLQRVPGSKRFSGGDRMHALALSALGNSAIGAPRHAVLQSLSDEVEETCNCTVLEGNQIVYFDRVEANWPYRIHLPVGTRVPLHCTASGKLFLALMPSSQRDDLLNTLRLTRHTERTITDRMQLDAELDSIRDTGIAEDNSEYLDGLISLAIPVLDPHGRICFGIAIHAPTARRTMAELRQYLPAMRSAAGKLSTIVGATD